MYAFTLTSNILYLNKTAAAKLPLVRFFSSRNLELISMCALF